MKILEKMKEIIPSSKLQSIKFSDYVRILKPEYSYLRLTPDTSIKNYNSANIVKAVHHMQKTISQRIYREEKQWIVEPMVKCSYLIDITKEDVGFYFVVPKQFIRIAIEKIREIWPNITIEETAPVAPHAQSAAQYQLVYKKEDALSLAVDKKSNEPLNHILNVMDILEEKDRVTLYYNFVPCPQFGWSAEYGKTMQKIKNREPIERQKMSLKYAGKMAVSLLLEFAQGVLDTATEMTGGSVKGSSEKEKTLSVLDLAMTTMNYEKDLKDATKKKKTATVIDTQLMVLSTADNKSRQHQNATTVCQAFKSIEEDNELVFNKVPNKEAVNFEKLRPHGAESNKMSIDECQNLIQLPGRELLLQFKNISRVDVTQTEVPAELQNGIIRAGYNMFKGKRTEVTHTEHLELKNTAICLCGPNRSGKSTLIANMVYDMIMDGRTVILPDFCGKCQLSDELSEVIPANKIVDIYCNDWNTLQGFGWNEIKPKDDSPFELYNAAKMKATRLKDLINLINDGDNDLEGRMERLMFCAAFITFVNNGSVNDVFKMLKDHVMRHNLMDSIPADLQDKMEEYVTELQEIDEIQTKGEDKGAVIGTKYGHISAILSRVHRLKENSYVEMMLQKDVKDNIDLLEIIQQGKLIRIRMYDNMFVSQQQKDIYVCYWLTKIWGALQTRYCENEGTLVQTGILVDELYQTKNAEKYLTTILSQIPKYRAKLVISCHHLGQIPVIQEELKSAMCSYMFLRGANKKNYYSMKEEFEDLGFSLDDLLHLKQYQSLNLFSYEDGLWAGITQLPLPVRDNPALKNKGVAVNAK